MQRFGGLEATGVLGQCWCGGRRIPSLASDPPLQPAHSGRVRDGAAVLGQDGGFPPPMSLSPSPVVGTAVSKCVPLAPRPHHHTQQGLKLYATGQASQPGGSGGSGGRGSVCLSPNLSGVDTCVTHNRSAVCPMRHRKHWRQPEWGPCPFQWLRVLPYISKCFG